MEIGVAQLGIKRSLIAIVGHRAPVAIVRVSEEVEGQLPPFEADSPVLLADYRGRVRCDLAVVGFVLAQREDVGPRVWVDPTLGETATFEAVEAAEELALGGFCKDQDILMGIH